MRPKRTGRSKDSDDSPTPLENVHRRNHSTRRSTIIILDDSDSSENDESMQQGRASMRRRRQRKKLLRKALDETSVATGTTTGDSEFVKSSATIEEKRSERENYDGSSNEPLGYNDRKRSLTNNRSTNWINSGSTIDRARNRDGPGGGEMSTTGKRRIQPLKVESIGESTKARKKIDDNRVSSEAGKRDIQGKIPPIKKQRLVQSVASKFESVERPCTPTVLKDNEIATADFLKSHCWVCKKRVMEIDGNIALYAMHVHPFLNVPCCVLCCDELVAMDSPNDQDDCDQCCACASDEVETLLLCDICPSGFCETCVAQAYGGGCGGLQQMQRLVQENSRSWACIRCNPPSQLTELQITHDIVQGVTELENVDENTESDSLEEIIAKLDIIEDDLDHCDRLLEEEEQRRLKAEIWTEFTKTIQCSEQLERLVAEELDLWHGEHMEHYIRVQDYKVDLLERLNRHGISDDQYFKYRAEKNPIAVSDGDGDGEWRRLADAEIAKRIENENVISLQEQKLHERRVGQNLGGDSSDSEAEEKRAFAIVEDLCTSSQCEEWETEDILASRKQWRSSVSASKEYIEMKLNRYAARDDMFLRNAGSRLVVIDKDSDDKAVEEEIAYASSKSVCGLRIRRDAIQAVQMKLKNERTLPNVCEQGNGTRSGGVSDEVGYPSMSRSHLSVSSSHTEKRPLDKSAAPERHGVSEYGRDDEFNRIEDCTDPNACSHGQLWDSCLEICSEEDGNNKRSVRVASGLASELKPHQVDGIRFMWQNSFKDLSTVASREEALEERDVGGCILAHTMGLGKSLQVVALVHTILHHPTLRPLSVANSKPFLHKILLIVPVNTIVNWTNEFNKWTGKLEHSVRYFDYSSVRVANRSNIIQDWSQMGGVLIIGAEAFTRLAKNETDVTLFHNPGPDAVFIDEAHTMLITESSEISRVLRPMRTMRRIALTGTPFVNNLKEYFNLMAWSRPGVLGTFAEFDRTYAQKISIGLASDSPADQVAEQVRTSKMLNRKLAPFMQRRDQSFLTKELPPSQTVVLYIRQSKLQSRLYRAYEKHLKKLEDKPSFLSQYQMIRPLHNHPHCLWEQRMVHTNHEGVDRRYATAPTACRNGARGAFQTAHFTAQGLSRGRKSMDYSWMDETVSTNHKSSISSVHSGYKIYLLLQILAKANAVGDKVVVFSQCLRTLDFVEKVLGTGDWARYCSGHESSTGLGSWKKGVDYLRIDGSVDSSQRGLLVSSFQEELGSIKAFLLSIAAGGIGINLVAANRVVILDNHWNPTVSSQAFHRCYRFGQKKPVFGYRFITQGSMEEKIYKRSMNKSGIGARVIDLKFPERSFSRRELDEIQVVDTWARCDRCQKWRLLFFNAEEDLPEKWFCEDNNDPLHRQCSVPERNVKWYEKNRNVILNVIPNPNR